MMDDNEQGKTDYERMGKNISGSAMQASTTERLKQLGPHADESVGGRAVTDQTAITVLTPLPAKPLI